MDVSPGFTSSDHPNISDRFLEDITRQMMNMRQGSAYQLLRGSSGSKRSSGTEISAGQSGSS
jgi:hypothetical protein